MEFTKLFYRNCAEKTLLCQAPSGDLRTRAHSAHAGRRCSGQKTTGLHARLSCPVRRQHRGASHGPLPVIERKLAFPRSNMYSARVVRRQCLRGGMVDAADLKSADHSIVPVRVRSEAPCGKCMAKSCRCSPATCCGLARAVLLCLETDDLLAAFLAAMSFPQR